MANTFQLEILASDRPFYVGPAEQLVFPTVDGLMGILPGHESMVTVVSPGELPCGSPVFLVPNRGTPGTV